MLTNDPTGFLVARLDEDEQTAKAATWDAEMSARWKAGSSSYDKRRSSPRWYVMDAYDDGVVGDVDPQGNDDEGVARHIARHDPARVLAEVDAKRRIAREHGPSDKHTTVWDWPELGTWCGECGADPCRELNACPICGASDGCRTLRLLALPYADHPDYLDEWRL